CQRRAFTFTELLVVVALLSVVMAGVVPAHLTGMRMVEITKAKLGANDEARASISLLIEEVRTAKRVKIGSGTANNFSEVAPNGPQQGSAAQIYPTLDTTQFIRYYYDQNTRQLMRTTSDGTATTVAHSITNDIVFTAENFSGTVLTNNENNRVIGVTLQFYQIQYPIIRIGPGEFYDFYQLRTKITRRALE
ncbi:MAG TPA: prepilin-type N-terminal cleavage/methylation domain-containing protein, partial [Candidatus Kapabacteria bacterium]|nr:prepilin-type N-terminal cleavage/methylation domain-containing protein [Candidatus Kapabacteria bacterium]